MNECCYEAINEVTLEFAEHSNLDDDTIGEMQHVILAREAQIKQHQKVLMDIFIMANHKGTTLEQATSRKMIVAAVLQELFSSPEEVRAFLAEIKDSNSIVEP